MANVLAILRVVEHDDVIEPLEGNQRIERSRALSDRSTRVAHHGQPPPVLGTPVEIVERHSSRRASARPARDREHAQRADCDGAKDHGQADVLRTTDFFDLAFAFWVALGFTTAGGSDTRCGRRAAGWVLRIFIM